MRHPRSSSFQYSLRDAPLFRGLRREHRRDPPQAAGQILYHRERSRTVAAEERFYVRGTLVIMLLGQNTPCEIEEEQVFKLRIVEKPLP